MKFFYLFITTFILISTFSLKLSEFKKTDKSYKLSTPTTKEGQRKVYYAQVPFLKESFVFPELSAQSIMASDLPSGKILFDANSDTPLLPASTTKIVTALVSMDKYPMEKILTVGKINIEGQKMHLVEGEKISVKNLLSGLLIASANDAAEVLAENYPGGRNAFIEAMNDKVKNLELTSSSFKNPTGLDGDNHLTTARDLVFISAVAMQRPFFKKTVASKKMVVTSEDGKVVHGLRNLNELVGEVEGVLGVKTGWTENARENLVTYVERGDRKIMIAVLGSEDRFGETRKLIDWIFKNYEWKRVRKDE